MANVLALMLIISLASCKKNDDITGRPDQAEIQCLLSGLKFAEGPAYLDGCLFFSDIQANKIYKWNEAIGLQVFEDNLGGPNGLYFDRSGYLFACEGSKKRIIRIGQDHDITTVADTFNGKPFNEPNDLWVSPKGDIYFTDPVYSGNLSQDGEYVYCIKAATEIVTKMLDDLVKPNGIIGNQDKSMLYVADWGASTIYQYSIEANGNLTNKTIFAGIRADGLSIDNEGNVYAASNAIMIYNPAGKLLDSISIPGTLTNLTLVTTDKKRIYATTHDAVYQFTIK